MQGPNNSIIHMTIFGVAIGAGVGFVTMLVVIVISINTVNTVPLAAAAANTFFGLYAGAMVGGVIGAITGALNGAVLKLVLRSAQFPLADSEKRVYVQRANRLVGVLTAVVALIAQVALSGGFVVLMLIPAALAAFGMVYAVGFFLRRWELYSGIVEEELYISNAEDTVRGSTQIYPPADIPQDNPQAVTELLPRDTTPE
ncbi:MAG: hypothetical protein KC496_03250 [Anaerolineae bacterium]|nr:hypothetical protein [Anaerolineae bacterium]